MKYLSFLTNIPENVRHLLYQVSTALVLLAGTYGLLNEQQAAGWLALAAALFSGTLAVANTSKKLPPPPPPEFP